MGMNHIPKINRYVSAFLLGTGAFVAGTLQAGWGPGGIIAELDSCESLLASCRARICVTFPGDGQTGNPLSYTQPMPGDGTFVDDNTGLMWEIKDSGDTVQDYANPHDVDNTYSWSQT